MSMEPRTSRSDTYTYVDIDGHRATNSFGVTSNLESGDSWGTSSSTTLGMETGYSVKETMHGFSLTPSSLIDESVFRLRSRSLQYIVSDVASRGHTYSTIILGFKHVPSREVCSFVREFINVPLHFLSDIQPKFRPLGESTILDGLNRQPLQQRQLLHCYLFLCDILAQLDVSVYQTLQEMGFLHIILHVCAPQVYGCLEIVRDRGMEIAVINAYLDAVKQKPCLQDDILDELLRPSAHGSAKDRMAAMQLVLMQVRRNAYMPLVKSLKRWRKDEVESLVLRLLDAPHAVVELSSAYAAPKCSSMRQTCIELYPGSPLSFRSYIIHGKDVQSFRQGITFLAFAAALETVDLALVKNIIDSCGYLTSILELCVKTKDHRTLSDLCAANRALSDLSAADLAAYDLSRHPCFMLWPSWMPLCLRATSADGPRSAVICAPEVNVSRSNAWTEVPERIQVMRLEEIKSILDIGVGYKREATTQLSDICLDLIQLSSESACTAAVKCDAENCLQSFINGCVACWEVYDMCCMALGREPHLISHYCVGARV